MKKQSLVLFFLATVSLTCYSQITFEKGYFIDETNQRTECTIRNIDWEDNPTGFQYKLSATDEIKNISIGTVKEFGIDGICKYVRANVKIDRSSDDLNRLTTEKNPVYTGETLFLKVLVEGNVSLLMYKDGNLKRFFYKTSDADITQLIYRRYRTANNSVAENISFKQQVFEILKCPDLTIGDSQRLSYTQRSLEQIFVKYNACGNPPYIHSEPKEKRDFFSLALRPGAVFGKLSMENNSAEWKSVDFGSEVNLRLGVEAEFMLPYRKNTWAIMLEPTFQYFESEHTKATNDVSGGERVAKITYRSIELPAGLRHYIFLKNESRLFLNLAYIIDVPIDSQLTFFRADGSELMSYEVRPKANLTLGFGYRLKGHYIIEARYQTGREIMGGYPEWNSRYRSFSMILGYAF